MYDIVKSVILSKNYELVDMLKKIDTVWVSGDLTDEQRTELIELARTNADVGNSVEIMQKLEDLDKRVTALENSGGGGGTEPSDEYPEYVVGKWYYKDDKVTFEGKKYTCIAPEGQVCTWSPTEYPAYWQEVKQ